RGNQPDDAGRGRWAHVSAYRRPPDLRQKRAGAMMAGMRRFVPRFGLLCAMCVVRAAADSPNIVFILLDDQGYGDLSCQGAEGFATPNFDRMAAEGTRFTNFHVGQGVCTASRAALMTGCYPNRVGLGGALNHTS